MTRWCGRLALLAVAASCNQVFDIGETDPAIDVLDLDADAIDDTIDNCPEVANPDQLDGELDGIGDACDRCPATVSDDQHDEDRDGLGDVCDPCPGLRDFGADTDGDQVGDLCERDSRISIRSYFDPFVTVRPELTPGAIPWIAVDDEVAPVEVLPANDAGLRALGVVLTSNAWAVRASTRSVTRWGAGERFGLRVRDMVTGQIAGACIVTCTDKSICQATIATGAGGFSQFEVAAAVPEVEMTLSVTYDPVAMKASFACVMRPLQTLKVTVSGVPPLNVTPELLGSPNVHFRNLEALQ